MNWNKYIQAFLSFIFYANCVFADPIVTSVNPAKGDIIGGNVVIITGSGFTSTSAVDFGSRPAAAFTVLDDHSISATVPQGTPGTVDVRITAASQTSPMARADFYTYTTDAWTGIISGINQDAITLFDTATNTISGTIVLSDDSLAAVMTPDGTRIYAADANQARVIVIDAATNAIIDMIPTSAGPGAFDIIVSPDGKRVYISNNASGYVTIVNTETNAEVTNVFVALNLGPLSITPDGKTVYVSDFSFGNITAIDTESTTVIASIGTGAEPGMIAITPDGTTAFVANRISNYVSVVNISTQTVINTIPFPPGAGPYGSFITPNGKKLYVANLDNSSISVIDVTTQTIVDTILLVPNTEPFWVVSTPNGKTMYVINQGTDDVTPIDVATNVAGSSFAQIPGQMQDIVMSPDQAPIASFTSIAYPVGCHTLFDASASLSPIGSIASYAWDFGDGSTEISNSPIIYHKYTKKGEFSVSLTVTNTAGTSTSKVFSSRFMSNNGGPTATVSQTVEIRCKVSLKGSQKVIKNGKKTKLVNVIKWRSGEFQKNISEYRIYRDFSLTQLIGTISAAERMRFEDYNVEKGLIYTYYVVAVSDSGELSVVGAIKITPKQ